MRQQLFTLVTGFTVMHGERSWHQDALAKKRSTYNVLIRITTCIDLIYKNMYGLLVLFGFQCFTYKNKTSCHCFGGALGWVFYLNKHLSTQ